jgi:hypothetical protein
VGGAGEVLHLAPRSVRDLIYAGRLPSVRLGRLHFVSTTDLELERRRRLGLALPARRARRTRPRTMAPRRPRGVALVDPAVRARRAEQRAAALERAHPEPPVVPFQPDMARSAASCGICGSALRPGQPLFVDQRQAAAKTLCARCGRRALLTWADERAREAAAARQLAREPVRPPAPTRLAAA